MCRISAFIIIIVVIGLILAIFIEWSRRFDECPKMKIFLMKKKKERAIEINQ